VYKKNARLCKSRAVKATLKMEKLRITLVGRSIAHVMRFARISSNSIQLFPLVAAELVCYGFSMALGFFEEYRSTLINRESEDLLRLAKKRGLPESILIAHFEQDRLHLSRVAADLSEAAGEYTPIDAAAFSEELPPLLYRLGKAFGSGREPGKALYAVGLPRAMSDAIGAGTAVPLRVISPGLAAAIAAGMRDSDNPVPQILHLEQTIRLCSLGEAISQGMLPAGEDTNGADADISGIIIDLDGPPSQTYPRGSAGALLQRAWQDYLGQTGGDGISFRRISIGFRRNQEAEVQLVRELTRILATMCINILQVDTERDIQVLSPLSDIGPALQASLRDAMRQQLLPQTGPAIWDRVSMLLDHRRQLLRGCGIYGFYREQEGGAV
jgi:hypothetical protein